MSWLGLFPSHDILINVEKKEYKAEGSKIKNDNKICSYLRFVWKAAKELLVVFYIVQLLK